MQSGTQIASKRFLAVVNETDELRSWTGQWLSAGRDLRKILPLLRELNSELKYHRRVVTPAGILESDTPEPIMELGTELYAPDLPEVTGGNPALFWASTNGEKPYHAATFLEFVFSADAQALERCARSSCPRFFLRMGRRRKYCSNRCGQGDSAKRANRKRRKREQQKRLRHAKRLCKKYENVGAWPWDWKERVGQKVGTSKNWVTRQVTSGRLPGPPA